MESYPKVPRVDLQCLSHIAGDTHKLRQDKWTLLALFLCEHKLHARRVHTVPEWSDNSKIGHTEESIKLVLLYGLVALGTPVSLIFKLRRKR